MSFDHWSPEWEKGSGVSPDAYGDVCRRRSTPLNRRNSNIWLASAIMDSGLTTGMNFRNNSRIGLDTLPGEIIAIILQNVADDGEPYSLYQLLTTCGRIYDVGIAALYRHVLFHYPQTFDKFRWSIEATRFGQHVRVLDFSAFTSVGLGRSARDNATVEMVTSQTIARCLDQCPNVCEFLASESIDTDLSSGVIDQILALPLLRTLDFCGASDNVFISGVKNSRILHGPGFLENLSRLSLHCCSTLAPEALHSILSKLSSVTMLDLTHTQIRGAELDSMPDSETQLTHLSLARCSKATGSDIVRFIRRKGRNLQWLRLSYEISRPCPLTKDQVSQVLRALPETISHLDLYGLRVDKNQLLDNVSTQNLLSLSLGYAEMSLDDVIEVLNRCPRLEYVNLLGVTSISRAVVQDTSLLNANPGIDMFEFSTNVLKSLTGVSIPGFLVDVGRGRRAWLHRVDSGPRKSIPGDPLFIDKPQKPFSFARLAQERMEANYNPPAIQKPLPPPGNSPIWRHASHKLNISEIDVGGATSPTLAAGIGIYNYYSFNVL